MLLNINFNSILTQILRPTSAPAENKPLAVMGKFYSRLFAYTASLIESIKDEPEAVVTEITATKVSAGVYTVTDTDGKTFTTDLTGSCSCNQFNCKHAKYVKSLNGKLLAHNIKSPTLRRLAVVGY